MRSMRTAGVRSNSVSCSSAPFGEISANRFPVAAIGKSLSRAVRGSDTARRDRASSCIGTEFGENVMDSATLARAAKPAARPIPFDTARLDELLQDAGVDALLVTSKHNVQYLLGGYRFFFFDYMDAIGVSRYLPVLVYRRGRPEAAAYIGYRLEAFENELGKFWPPWVKTASSGAVGVITAGNAMKRPPSHQRREPGDITSLESGGNYRGYIGDLCRMGILGEQDYELPDLRAAADAIQHAARKPIRRGARGGDIFVAA